MKSKNGLLLAQGLLTIFIIVSFGLIIINEKKAFLFSNIINKKIDNYIEEKYSSLKDFTSASKVTIEKNTWRKQIISNKNKNYYFEVYYKKNSIRDTYQEDYVKGKSFLNYLSNKLEKQILKTTDNTCKIKPLNTLNEYSENIQKKLIEEDNLLGLRFYYLEQELLIDNWNSESITNEIKNKINIYKNNNILPKYYIFTVTSKEDITTSIKISYITNSFLDLNNAEEVIDDILNDKDSTNLRKTKIQYKYV